MTHYNRKNHELLLEGLSKDKYLSDFTSEVLFFEGSAPMGRVHIKYSCVFETERDLLDHLVEEFGGVGGYWYVARSRIVVIL